MSKEITKESVSSIERLSKLYKWSFRERQRVDEYAKQRAIAFFRWIGFSEYNWTINLGKISTWYAAAKEKDKTPRTLDEVYDIFLNDPGLTVEELIEKNFPDAWSFMIKQRENAQQLSDTNVGDIA